MELRYKNTKTKELCTSLKAARKFFGGNDLLAQSLHARVNALMQAENLKDIIVQVHFRFHSLQGERSGTYAIDVKSHRDPWRIIIQPLDKNEEPYHSYMKC